MQRKKAAKSRKIEKTKKKKILSIGTSGRHSKLKCSFSKLTSRCTYYEHWCILSDNLPTLIYCNNLNLSLFRV